MLVRVLVFAGVMAAAASQVPLLLQKGGPTTDAKTSAFNVSIPQQPPVAIDAHGNVRLRANPQGHYTADFKINGKPVEGMIDTGATFVAINESTARHLGYGAADLDFRNTMSTANGDTKAALVRLDRIEIGSIRVRDVDAVVLRDAALSSTLIGVSFLKRLASYSVEDGSLRLTE
jgi:aspartyl protease family protein